MLKQSTPRRRKARQIPILIVEDNADQWLIIRAVFAQCFPETQPIWVNCELQARTYMTTHAQDPDKLPRMVLSDLYLPRREDGLALLEFMQSFQFYRKPPVIIFSSSPTQEDIDKVYSYGVASYILKPHTYHEWQNCITTFRRYWWDVVTLPLRKE
jgi:response regulator of citrate/malate metabolism